MESFGLPCVHILAILVRLDIDSLPKSLVLARWSKAAKEDLCYELLSSQYGDAGVLYWSRLGAFLQHCKRLAKAACIRDEDFRQYLAKVVEDTCLLEKTNGLRVAVFGTGVSNSGGRVRDPVSVRTKGTECGNEPLGSRGIKRCHPTQWKQQKQEEEEKLMLQKAEELHALDQQNHAAAVKVDAADTRIICQEGREKLRLKTLLTEQAKTLDRTYLSPSCKVTLTNTPDQNHNGNKFS
ncbi:hypothetical protein AHAS_Ahas20G0037200 [Arachis hypogaea]